MNVTVQRDFAKAVATVRHATDAKSLPILSHLLLEARDQQIRITGTDLSTSIRLTVPAEVTSPGALALPAHHLAEITHALPADATLTLAQTDEDSVQLVCGRAHYRIKGLPPADFPQFPGAPESNWLTLPAPVFADLVKKTEFAVDTKADRPHLSGIALSATADALRASATNGHRLATVTLPQGNGSQDVDAIIPPKGLVFAARLASERQGDVRLSFPPHQGHFVVQQDGFTVATRLIDGSFPDVTRVIPVQREQGLELRRESLRATLRRLTPILTEIQSVTFTPTDTSLVVSGRNADLGEGREDLDYTPIGTPASFSLQAKYLLEYLDRVTAETLRLYVTGPLDPILVLPVGDDTYTYIVMPIRGD
jgi:DNA polymerase-3 subunit beta